MSPTTRNIKIAVIAGDGIGPEIAEATRRCVDAAGAKIQWDIQEAGVDIMATAGTPLPDQTLKSIVKTEVTLKAPITTPVGTGFRSINVHLRQHFDLYACLRPCKSYQGVRSRYEDIDLVIVRENTEDLYAGIEYEKGTHDVNELVQWINSHSKRQIRPNSGISIKPISVAGTQRIVKFAFDYARQNHRKKVTSVHKANIMKHTDGLWLEVSREVAKQYPDIEFEDRIVDNMCMQLVQKPELYDVIVLPNLYGDILSDLCAGLVGGLGMAPGLGVGPEYCMAQATHGSAPDIAGKNIANPYAMIMSGQMMLSWLANQKKDEAGIRAAEDIARAVEAILTEGQRLTPDLGGKFSTVQMGEAIIERLKQTQS